MILAPSQYVLLFFIYSFMGWVLEVLMLLGEEKKFVNRGFLIGPYCPIYGCGSLFITTVLYRYVDDAVTLFIMTVLSCGLLEYFTSWVMEAIFKARWWDYSKRKFNINGRVCLRTLIPFGFMGLLVTYVLNPIFIELFNGVDILILNIIAIILTVIFVVDFIVSAKIITNIRLTTIKIGRESRHDNTNEITKKVRETLLEKSWVYRRLVKAFPTYEAIKYRIKEIKDDIKESTEEIKNNLNEKAEKMKSEINERKEHAKRKARISWKLSQRNWTRTLNEKINKNE